MKVEVLMTASSATVEGRLNGIRPAAAAGVPVRVPFAAPFTVAVRRSMILKVAALQEGSELAAVTFFVREPVEDTQPQA